MFKSLRWQFYEFTLLPKLHRTNFEFTCHLRRGKPRLFDREFAIYTYFFYMNSNPIHVRR